jgi:hypothetical protein
MVDKHIDINEAVRRTFEYPGVTELDYLRPYVFLPNSFDNAISYINPHSIVITEGEPLLLPRAKRKVPSYTIDAEISDGASIRLERRIALLGIGSNSSQDVLVHSKFQRFQATESSDHEILIAPAALEDFGVVHGGFLRALGAVPAMLYKHEGTVSKVTVGFYDVEAAAHLTRTEPNYKGILIEGIARLWESNFSITNPLAYVSIWGPLRDPSAPHQPLALTEIPSATSLHDIESIRALRMAYTITEGIDLSESYPYEVIERLRPYVAESIQDPALRSKRTALLQEHSLPTNVHGEIVFEAGLFIKRSLSIINWIRRRKPAP